MKLNRKKIQEIYENIPEGYYESSIKDNIVQRYWHKQRFTAVKNLIRQDIPCGKVLDAGCSDGTFSKIIYEAANSPKMTGIDFSPKAIAYAKKRHPEIAFTTADCYSLPFKDKTFGAVFSLEVLEHLYNPSKALKELRRCLKDSGYMVILVPNENLLFRFVWFWVTKLKGKIWKDAHVHQFNEKELVKICTSSGLKVVKVYFLLFRMLLLVKAVPINNTSFEKLNEDFYEKTLNYDWTEVADHFYGPESFFHRWREWVVTRFVKSFDSKLKYLDAGCGSGLILRHLPKGSIGLDANKKILKIAQKHVPTAKLVCGSILKMPFPDNSFDVVVCTEVLEHLLKPEKAMDEIKRVLKPMGKIIGTVPRESLFWRLQRFSVTGPKIPYHKHYQSPKELESLLKGFHVLKLRKAVGGLLYVFVAEK